MNNLYYLILNWFIFAHFLQADLALRPKVTVLFDEANELIEKAKIDFFISIGTIYKTFTPDSSNTVSEITHKIPQENQLEREIYR